MAADVSGQVKPTVSWQVVAGQVTGAVVVVVMVLARYSFGTR